MPITADYDSMFGDSGNNNGNNGTQTAQGTTLAQGIGSVSHIDENAPQDIGAHEDIDIGYRKDFIDSVKSSGKYNAQLYDKK